MQTTDLMIAPMVQSPGGLIKFRQALAGVNEHGKDGDPSASFTNRKFSDFGIFYIYM